MNKIVKRIKYCKEYRAPIIDIAFSLPLFGLCYFHPAWIILPLLLLIGPIRQAYYIRKLLKNPIYLGWKLSCGIKEMTGEPILSFKEHCDQIITKLDNPDQLETQSPFITPIVAQKLLLTANPPTPSSSYHYPNHQNDETP